MGLQARIKPYDPKRGHVVQRITLSELDGKRFEQGHWYVVSDAEARVLRQHHQIYNDKKSPKVFDVMSAEEADDLLVEETRFALLRTPNARSLVVAPTRDGVEEPRAATPEELAEKGSDLATQAGPKKRKA